MIKLAFVARFNVGLRRRLAIFSTKTSKLYAELLDVKKFTPLYGLLTVAEYVIIDGLFQLLQRYCISGETNVFGKSCLKLNPFLG